MSSKYKNPSSTKYKNPLSAKKRQNLDGHVIYRYDISGLRGLAVDQQGYVYISGEDSDDIHRLSPDGTFRDIVLSERSFLSLYNKL
jgi:sugar lactone lactonase YvrE